MEGADTLYLEQRIVASSASTTGCAVKVPVDTYFSTYQTDILPTRFKTDKLISWVENELKKAKYLNKSGWLGVKLRKQVKENATLKGLEPIAKMIHDLCITWNRKAKAKTAKVPQRTTRLVCRPNPDSKVRGGSVISRFILMKSNDAGGEVDDTDDDTSDAEGVMEGNEDRAVSHRLLDDPCRRFALSFSVEGDMMRFWYFSRSHIAVTAEFDHHKNPRDFIRFIIFMTFAPLERLGYDRNVVRVQDKNKAIQHRFTCGDKKNQTNRCVNETSAIDIVTRATRVWPMQGFDSNDQSLAKNEVLKDVWLYVDAEAAKDSKDGNCRRIVFAEECQTLYTVDNYGDFALALAQLVNILDSMRSAGLIHGNICPGNCLVSKKEGHIKISDLEYARRYDSQEQSILPLSGTPNFMAVEYQASMHYFLPNWVPTTTGGSWEDADKPQGGKSWFRFNFLHDLESVLWILLSHLLTTVPDCLHADDPDVVEKHEAILELYDLLFDGSLEGSLKRYFFVTNIENDNRPTFEEARRVLKAFYEKANATPLCKIMSAFMYLVRCCYKTVEHTVPCVDQATPYWDPAHFEHKFYYEFNDLFMKMHHAMAGVGYRAVTELQEASDEPDPPSPLPERESNDQVAPKPDAGSSRSSRKRHADASVGQAQKKKPKTDTGVGSSRLGKRRAEDAAAVQAAKRPKRATAPEPLRRSARLKNSGASSGAAKGPARKTKRGSAESSGAGTSAAAGSSRAARPVAGTKRVSKSAGNKKA